jgi:hypothetical protein
MVLGSKIAAVTYDTLKGLNATIWDVEGAEKTNRILKTGLSATDVVIGSSHALEDFACNDLVCTSFDVVGSVSTAIGMFLGNFPSTKHLTIVTGSVTVCCRSVRLYCKNYGTFWECTVAAGHDVKHCVKKAIKFTVKR